MISGVQCIGFKDKASGHDGQTGETWVAPSLNYQLVETTIPDKQNNTLIEIVLEDIQAGTRPDPLLFRIPEGFQTLDVDRVE